MNERKQSDKLLTNNTKVGQVAPKQQARKENILEKYKANTVHSGEKMREKKREKKRRKIEKAD